MSFIVRKTNHRAWPVTIALFVCDAQGVVTEHESTFIGHFKSISEVDRNAIDEMLDQKHPATVKKTPEIELGPEGFATGTLYTPPTMAEILARNADLFAALMCGWGPEVRDEAGEPLPFSEQELRALVTGADGPAISVALHNAIAELRYGRAPQKNVSTSPAPTVGSGEAAPPSEACDAATSPTT